MYASRPSKSCHDQHGRQHAAREPRAAHVVTQQSLSWKNIEGIVGVTAEIATHCTALLDWGPRQHHPGRRQPGDHLALHRRARINSVQAEQWLQKIVVVTFFLLTPTSAPKPCAT